MDAVFSPGRAPSRFTPQAFLEFVGEDHLPQGGLLDMPILSGKAF